MCTSYVDVYVCGSVGANLHFVHVSVNLLSGKISIDRPTWSSNLNLMAADFEFG